MKMTHDFYCFKVVQERQLSCRTAGLPDFAGLAHYLEAAWTRQGRQRTRERLLRALITDIIADVDEATRSVVLTARRPALATAGPRAELR